LGKPGGGYDTLALIPTLSNINYLGTKFIHFQLQGLQFQITAIDMEEVCNLRVLFILVINQLDAQNFVLQYIFSIPLHVLSTMCSLPPGQNYIIQPLISSSFLPFHKFRVLYQSVHRKVSYKCDDTRGCIIKF